MEKERIHCSNLSIHIDIDIYIYIYRERERERESWVQITPGISLSHVTPLKSLLMNSLY